MGNKNRSPFYDNALLLMGITLCLWVITIIDQNTPDWNLTINYGIKASRVKEFLEANRISLKYNNRSSKDLDVSDKLENSTVYIFTY